VLSPLAAGGELEVAHEATGGDWQTGYFGFTRGEGILHQFSDATKSSEVGCWIVRSCTNKVCRTGIAAIGKRKFRFDVALVSLQHLRQGGSLDMAAPATVLRLNATDAARKQAWFSALGAGGGMWSAISVALGAEPLADLTHSLCQHLQIDKGDIGNVCQRVAGASVVLSDDGDTAQLRAHDFVVVHRKPPAQPGGSGSAPIANEFVGAAEQILSSSSAEQYASFQNLARMTDGFTETGVIGRGGFGPVYKGQNGAKEIAVKMNGNEAMAMVGGQGRREFDRELQTLRMCRHESIVPLLGSCNQEGHPLCLVYPFMANGSLFDALLPSSSVHLDAAQRVDIALGVARGLRYLHAADTDAFHDKPSIIHRDIKSANILLDSQLRARICDVGLAREADSGATMTGGVGTPGYVDPEYGETLQFTAASDVFSLGVVLVELLRGVVP
jgi:hypothetical protein